jgi:hypothetical protein
LGKAKRGEMSLPDDISPLIEPLKALQRLLDKYEGRGVIIAELQPVFSGGRV